MKKKHIAITLLIIGITLICLSIVLAVIATGNKSIIGGADIPTLCFVFFYEHRGLYSTLAFFGVVAIVTSAVVAILNKKAIRQ